jgi:hypothetical protein
LDVFLNPLYFEIASFFIGDFYFKTMNKCYNNTHSFMALTYLTYQFLSNTELALLAILMMVINIFFKKRLYYVPRMECCVHACTVLVACGAESLTTKVVMRGI